MSFSEGARPVELSDQARKEHIMDLIKQTLEGGGFESVSDQAIVEAIEKLKETREESN